MFKYEEYNPPIRDQQAWNEYITLVEELRKTAPTDIKPKGYERHHIIAKCYLPKEFWNDKENILIIPARYHFRLHKLLDKAIGGKMTFAFERMLSSKQNGFKDEISEEEYQNLKERLSILRSEQFSKSQQGENNSFYGKKHSEKTLKKISSKLLGENNPNFGKPCPESTKQAVSKANKGNQYFKGHTLSKASREKLSNSLKGKPAWNKGIPQTPEVKRAISEKKKGRPNPNKGKKNPKLSGENHPMYGKHLSDSTREKISKAHQGEVWSEERRKEFSKRRKGCVYINNGNKNKLVKKEELQTFLDQGWTKGKIKRE